MVITDITQQKKDRGRMNLFIDGHFYASVSSRIVEEGVVSIGKQVTKAELEKVLFESDKANAFNYACLYVSKYYCVEKKLKDKLYEKGYGTPVVEYALNKLKDCGLLDDKKYVLDYYDSKKSTCGFKKIINDLAAKGVSKDDIAVLYSIIDHNEENSELESAMILAKKHSKGQIIDVKYLAKLSRYLCGKGFDWSVIRACLDTVKDGKDSDCQ